MKRDPKLMRELLFRLERLSLRPGEIEEQLTGAHPSLTMTGYSADQIEYHLSVLREDDLIDSPGSQPMDGVTFRGLSSRGHDYLEKLRGEAVKPAPPLESGQENMPRTALRGFSRERARQRLQLRIDEAKEIVPGRLLRDEDFQKAEEQEDRWYRYNYDLLRAMFTTGEFAYEYSEVRIAIHQAMDAYGDLSLADFERRLNESLRRQVARLESIAERIELIPEAPDNPPAAAGPQDRSKIFVVHGHDDGAREGVARFLEKLGFEVIILAEKPNRGRTVIEKFVDYARQGSFAVVVLTPDDLGGAAADEQQKERARQNVIFELGYFVGSLGRGQVCLLRKGGVEIPSDLYGVVYTKMDAGDGWKRELARELKDAGFKFDPEKVF